MCLISWFGCMCLGCQRQLHAARTIKSKIPIENWILQSPTFCTCQSFCWGQKGSNKNQEKNARLDYRMVAHLCRLTCQNSQQTPHSLLITPLGRQIKGGKWVKVANRSQRSLHPQKMPLKQIFCQRKIKTKNSNRFGVFLIKNRCHFVL